jgi:hypothetical protein
MFASAMRRKYLVISVILALVFCCLIVISTPKSRIDIGKTLTGDLRGRTVYVNVSCDDVSGRGSLGAPWRSYIEDEIRETLKAQGVLPSFVETNSEFIIDCRYRNGFCFPYVGRHWDVHASTFQSVRLKILDAKTMLVVCEIQAKRSRFTRPARDFIHEIISRAGIPHEKAVGSVLEK